MRKATCTDYVDDAANERAGTARICITVRERTVRSLLMAITKASADADLIEVRLDCLVRSELESFVGNLNGHLESAGRPVLLTLRSGVHGEFVNGFRDEGERRDFWFRHLSPERHCSAFVDIELEHAEELAALERGGEASLNWRRLICSYYSDQCDPLDLEGVYARLMQSPARLIRVETVARCVTDCITVFKILERAGSELRAIIATAAGRGAVPSLVLGPAFGSWLTFASPGKLDGPVAGQITAESLRTHYRLDKITKQTRLFGVVGNPGAQSIAPQVLNSAFVASGLDAVCVPFEATDILKFIRRMVRASTREIDWRLCGFSVMEPYKMRIPSALHWVDEVAKEIGAVRTVSIVNDLMCGYNTDSEGALVPLECVIKLHGARVAVIGCNGAALALLWSLRKAGAETTVLVTKSENCRELARKCGTRIEVLEGRSLSSFDVVINATSMGSVGPSVNATPVLAGHLRGVRIVYDLVYNPTDTRFLREARAAGCEAAINGLEGFLARASAEFQIWTGLEAPGINMRAAAMTAVRDMNISRSMSASGSRRCIK